MEKQLEKLDDIINDESLTNIPTKKPQIDQPINIKITNQIEDAAWFDVEDSKIEIDITKVARLRKLRKTEEEKTITGQEYQTRLKQFYNDKLKTTNFYGWAFDDEQNQIHQQSVIQDNEYDNNPNQILDKMLQTQYSVYTDNYKPQNLLNEIVDIERIGQIPIKDKHNAVIQDIDFHTNNLVFFTSGLDQLIKIFTIRENKPAFRDNIKLLKQVYVENFPISTAQFLLQKNQILLASQNKRHLLYYDLVSDKVEKISSHLFTQRFSSKIDKFVISPDQNYIAVYSSEGYIMILNAHTKQFLFEFKMNEECKSLCFSFDSKFLFSGGKTNKIYQWDLSKRSIFDVFLNEGSQCTNNIKMSSNGGFFAASSDSGVVNVFEYEKNTNKMKKEVIKEIQNLTTSIDNLSFNSQNEILLCASKWKINAIRLVHVPSFTVFANWPNFKTQVKLISACKFSHNGKYLAIGNDAGLTHIYNFKHYN
ncbi:WD repeat protein [Ichthyophthirius multifiliis]|uniref:WD repeat protein n=1 Tax=Ichthyophthirius multifiliis TaxID=5932 RepID=G0QVE1_ICHMU|nr:WD repeat protein [Ichthyophthirius multifiliis]EGR30830.1 WD repeat protein [Ichthyophthirius multifiliis]|eukprot:XP_004032417.1 WD repeat protein [Ichthyophthirius multifiliis]